MDGSYSRLTPTVVVALVAVALLLGIVATLVFNALQRARQRRRQFAALMQAAPTFTTATAAGLLAWKTERVTELIGQKLATGELVRNKDGSFSVSKPS